jgi:hypothetical protein
MFELVATQLDAQGYHTQAQLLRSHGRDLRARQAAAAGTSSSAATPIPTTSLAAQALPAASTSSVPPFVPTPETSQAGKALPADLQNMVAQALQNGTVPVLTSTAFVLEKAGFPAAAEELRKRAREIAATVPVPPPQDRPNVALDPNMPPDLALEVARQLQLQGDPNVLEALARQMRQRGFNNTADQLEAKAKQIRVMLDAAHTMSSIDTEIHSPGIAPALPAAAPQQTIPVTITATPPAPLPVPTTPQPQAVPIEKSKAQILAEALATSLNDLIDRFGSVPKARYKEDTAMVRRFQTQEALTSDGLYGPRPRSTWLVMCPMCRRRSTGRRARARRTSVAIARTSSQLRSTPSSSATPTAPRVCGRARSKPLFHEGLRP